MINFNNQKYFYEPYPHALYENVFDTPFYENLCDEFPSDQKFDNFDYDKQNKLKQKKFSLNDNHPSFKDILNNKKNINDLYNFLSNQKFKSLILDLLDKNHISLSRHQDGKNFLRKIYDKIIRNKRFGFEFSMISANGGFIKPHTDGADKLISFVIPIIKNNDFKNIPNSGTDILRPTEDKYKYNFFNTTVPFEATEVVRKIPFNKNQIFLFVKTHNSLHSVGPMANPTEKSLMRKSINFFIYK